MAKKILFKEQLKWTKAKREMERSMRLDSKHRIELITDMNARFADLDRKWKASEYERLMLLSHHERVVQQQQQAVEVRKRRLAALKIQMFYRVCLLHEKLQRVEMEKKNYELKFQEEVLTKEKLDVESQQRIGKIRTQSSKLIKSEKKYLKRVQLDRKSRLSLTLELLAEKTESELMSSEDQLEQRRTAVSIALDLTQRLSEMETRSETLLTAKKQLAVQKEQEARQAAEALERSRVQASMNLIASWASGRMQLSKVQKEKTAISASAARTLELEKQKQRHAIEAKNCEISSIRASNFMHQRISQQRNHKTVERIHLQHRQKTALDKSIAERTRAQLVQIILDVKLLTEQIQQVLREITLDALPIFQSPVCSEDNDNPRSELRYHDVEEMELPLSVKLLRQMGRQHAQMRRQQLLEIDTSLEKLAASPPSPVAKSVPASPIGKSAASSPSRAKKEVTIHTAVENASVEDVTFLQQRGADLGALEPKTQRNALHLISFSKENHRSRAEVLEFLLTCGANLNVNAVDCIGDTPLMLYASLGHLEFMQKLLQHGADIRMTNNRGQNVLHRACEEDQVEICGFLQQLMLKDSIAEDIIPIAAAYGQLDCMRLLLQAQRRFGPASTREPREQQQILHRPASEKTALERLEEAVNHLHQRQASMHSQHDDQVGGELEAPLAEQSQGGYWEELHRDVQLVEESGQFSSEDEENFLFGHDN
ncbi:hypothetical protein JG687_00006576 [Phytophthora cactorum]|uniref:Ankyrin repeat-containing domain n=1 Tax=Phytophthora cactorum TaxID=29920 RepID=A0A8T1UJ75_9STRA|nr:hypothetical protein JG687_00006576 [Phytophthora cactorum]